ncbi:MAG: DUF2490 domain-containing protein [Bacteroidetes bacterium]|nr:MAG: DUF2490 domain-containing protein [Bacteroidota bacterium]
MIAVTWSTRTLFVLCILLGLGLAKPLHAQDAYRLGLLPSLNLNGKMSELWTWNTKLEGRQNLREGVFTRESKSDSRYILSDISLIVAKKVGLNSRIGMGYLLRMEGQERGHRLIQQFQVVQRFSGFRLAHRFSTDQTFQAAQSPEYRLRYRITAELPLNGDFLDRGECYLKLGQEQLHAWQNQSYTPELRFLPFFGYQWNSKLKLESGLDYRITGLFQPGTQHRFWLALNAFIKL